jgi:hypothetical protein
MPTHHQKEDGDEEKGEDMIHPKLGDEWKLPPSPSACDISFS